MTSKRILPDGRPAPRLWIRYVCPECHVSEVCDAYRGAPTHSCKVPPPVMRAERVVDELDVPENGVA